jgi:hypothetical protein
MSYEIGTTVLIRYRAVEYQGLARIFDHRDRFPDRDMLARGGLARTTHPAVRDLDAVRTKIPVEISLARRITVFDDLDVIKTDSD